MKKLISLGVVSSMVLSMASMTSSIFGMERVSGKALTDLKVFVLNGENTSLANATEHTVGDNTINGTTIKNSIKLTGTNPDKFTVVVGLSKTAPATKFGKKPSKMPVFALATTKPIERASEGTFSNAGSTCSVVTPKLNVQGYADSVAIPGVLIDITNSTSRDKYAVYAVTIKDENANTRTINVAVEAYAQDKDNTSAADVDKNEDGYREFNDGADIGNGYPVSQAVLNAMVGQGKYQINVSNGISMVVAVSKATAKEGPTEVYTKVSAPDSAVKDRYSDAFAVVENRTFPNEVRDMNIDSDNAAVVRALGSDAADQIADGTIKRVYAYPVNEAGYDVLAANASANDGIVDTSTVIVGKVSDGKMAFSMPAGVTKVLISTKEIDPAALPAVPGVSIPENGLNEITVPENIATSGITAPVATVSAPSVVAPTVTSTPVLDAAPASTNAGSQNTGAKDIVTMAIVLATVSMAVAGVVAYKKSEI